jgi:GTPase Era involved in 16S rRNA processing/gas vesicle protein
LENTEKMKELITISNDLIELINTEEFFNEINSTEIKESLISLNSNLKDRRYTVAVIAAMKAGKSTLFNALLGNDLLPNETAACTVAITEIKFAKESSNVIKKHFKDGSIVEIKASGSKSLQENFHEDIRKCRKKDEVNNVDKYFIEHPIIALQDEQYTGLVENFLLIDTPGPNEANTGDFDTYALKETAYYQLRNADAIVFIFDYQVYKSETNARLLQDIFQGREDIKKDNGKIFFAVNKIDIRTSKDDSKNDIIKNVQKMITYNTGNIIGQPQVLPVSALMGVYGRELKNGTISEASREDCQKKYEGRYSEEQIINGRKYYAKLLPEELAEHLINDSDILGFENRVILDTFRKASSKMIDGVYTRLEDRISEIKQIIDSNIDIHTKGIEELREGIHKSKAEVMKLTEFSSTIQNNFDQKMRAIMVHLTEFISNFSSEINYEIDKQLDKYKDVYKAEDRNYLDEISSNIDRDCKYAVSNYCLKKQDEILRYYGQAKQELTFTIYKDFSLLSQRADAIIKKNLDIDIKTEGVMTRDITDSGVDLGSSAYEYNASIGEPIDFEDQAARGKKYATAGALIGFEIYGPVGAIIGGISGFILGIGTTKGTEIEQRRKSYTLDVTLIKTQLRQAYSQQAIQIENDFNDYIKRDSKKMNDAIQGNVEEFLQGVNQYLDDVEQKYSQERDNRERYIKYLSNMSNTVISLQERLLKTR